MHLVFLIILLLCNVSLPSFAQSTAISSPLLGKIHFPSSANREAQSVFEQAVLLLHSFEYEEARVLFQKAALLDPEFVLAYWGEAMTYNHPLWVEQDLEAARHVLAKLGKTEAERLAKARTPEEKGLLAAIHILYGKGNKAERDCAYASAMQALYRNYPDHDEIASFYALALLGSTEGERDFRVSMQAAGILELIYTKNPAHPGATHYAIHAYDDPVHAPLGLRAARSYAHIAPASSHALHMPSHIFLALGMWEDVIASNQAAWATHKLSAAPQSASSTHHNIHDYHALQWLSYGHLQKQEYQKAFALVKIMEQLTLQHPTPMTKWYYALMRAAYIRESKEWNADLQPVDMEGIELSARASDIYINVMIALQKHQDANTIQDAIHTLERLCQSIPHNVPKDLTPMEYFSSITSQGITIGKVIVQQLYAEVARAQNRNKEAMKALENAIALEETLPFGYGPPIPIKPAREHLADLLMAEKQYITASKHYLKLLERMPNKTHSVQGLERARKLLSKEGITLPLSVNPYFHKLMLSNTLNQL